MPKELLKLYEHYEIKLLISLNVAYFSKKLKFLKDFSNSFGELPKLPPN